MTSEFLHYRKQSIESDPGQLARFFEALPKNPKEILNVVGGLVLHTAFVAPAGIPVPPESAEDKEIRLMSEMIRRILSLDPGPLTQSRPPEKRFIGVCRHYALLACSIFRHHSQPTRLRVGFADYFEPGYYEDHWIVEYWSGAGWKLMDPELTPSVCRHFSISFDPCEVPRDRFLTAGSAWLGIRSGLIDQAKCGLSTLDIKGDWFVASSLVRDLAALNNREMLPWDYWGIVRDMNPGTSIDDTTGARLDCLANVIAGPDLNWEAVRRIYQNDEDLCVPSRILSFPNGEAVEVTMDH